MVVGSLEPPREDEKEISRQNRNHRFVLTMDSPYHHQASAPIEVDATPVPQKPFQNDFVQGEEYRRTRLHKFSLFLSIAAIGSAINMAVGQILGMILIRVPFEEALVRGYLIGFSLLVVLVEMEWTSIIRESAVLYNWIPRGVLYTFLGILGTTMNDIGNDSYYSSRMSQYRGYNSQDASFTIYIPSREEALETYIRFVSLSLFGVGLVYILTGALCVQKTVNRHREAYSEHSGKKGTLGDHGGKMCGVLV